MNRQLLSGAFSVLLALMLAGCELAAEATDGGATTRIEDVATVMVDTVNYQHSLGTKYTLYDLSVDPPRAVGGAFSNFLESGGSKGCCIALPKTWRPSIKVRLKWTESSRTEIFPEEHIRDLEIPKYDTPADLYVVFYPNHEVEVVSSQGEPGHPLWAGRIKQAPWDYCVEQNGRKPCWQALPKAGLGLDELQGFCTYLKDENDDMSLCDAALRGCIYDFEDEDLCKKTAWGPRRKQKQTGVTAQ